MKQFILDNWLLILSALVFIASFILQLVKKKPINSIAASIYEYAILAVKIIEEENILGAEQKLAAATTLVCKYLSNLYPTLRVNDYIDFIHYAIEDILSTPQKKGVNNETK